MIFLKILNFAYKSSNKKRLFKTFLNRIYEKKKLKVKRVFHTISCINFIIDEFININQQRIMIFIVQIFE